MTNLLLAAGAAVAFSLPAAQEPDPLSSSECAAARAELEAALSEPAVDRQVRAQRLARARQEAALACLGPTSGNRERSGAPQPPQAVPPPVIGVQPPPPAPPTAVAVPQPPLPVPRSAVITACDPAGCWDSEGRRLNNAGPLLMGPRGLCTLQAGVLNCP